MTTKLKLAFASLAVMAMTICCSSDANAQGLRLGKVFQAGGGQGFRVGSPRVGMQFGGGQGASFGVGRLGMRFGNGQGARFGGQSYGLQFGGQQGTQVGRFRTTPVVAPGGYYYQDVQNMTYAGTQYAGQTYQQPVVGQPTYVSPQQGVVFQPAYENGIANTGQPVMGDPQMMTSPVMDSHVSYDIAADLQTTNIEPTLAEAPMSAIQPAELAITDSTGGSVVTNDPAFVEATPVDPTSIEPIAETTAATDLSSAEQPASVELAGEIRLLLPETATENMTFTVNDMGQSLSPGGEMILQAGQNWAVKFPAGGDKGERAAELSAAGVFLFSQSAEEGWMLMERDSEATSIAEPGLPADESDMSSELDKAEPTPDIAPADPIVDDTIVETPDDSEDEN